MKVLFEKRQQITKLQSSNQTLIILEENLDTVGPMNRGRGRRAEVVFTREFSGPWLTGAHSASVEEGQRVMHSPAHALHERRRTSDFHRLDVACKEDDRQKAEHSDKRLHGVCDWFLKRLLHALCFAEKSGEFCS